MKRLLQAAALAAVALGLSAGTAEAQRGAPDFHIIDNKLFVYADGPGFNVLMTKFGIHKHINDARFGIPSAGFPIVRATPNLPTSPNSRPYVCENGTYRAVSGTFDQTSRGSSTERRPPPYTDAFNNSFRNVFTFVGIIEGIVTNQAGEQFRLYATDLAHEVITPTSFSSTNPIHAYFVDSRGRVRDHASLVGRVNIDRATGAAKHKIVDKGTCHQTANLGPGADQASVFGPFFVLPFNTTVVGD